MGKRITRINFLSIMRDVRDGMKSTEVAKKHHVSQGTVSNIRRANTWPGFVLQKQQATSYIANAKDRKFHAAQKAGLNPVRRTTVQRMSDEQARRMDAETALQKSLHRLDQFVTRDEFESAIHLLDERLDVHNFVIQKKADKKSRWWSRR